LKLPALAETPLPAAGAKTEAAGFYPAAFAFFGGHRGEAVDPGSVLRQTLLDISAADIAGHVAAKAMGFPLLNERSTLQRRFAKVSSRSGAGAWAADVFD
jgi:hypothetical protein